MTVTYKHASGDTVICHGLDLPGEVGYYTGPLGSDDTTQTEWSVEPIRPIGADHATPADRGCGVHTFALWVERRFATLDEAKLFAVGFAGSLPRKGVTLQIDDADAGKRIACDAALQKLLVRRTGCSCDIEFLFMTSVPVTSDIPE